MSDTVVSLFQYMGHQSRSSTHSASADLASQGTGNQVAHSSGTGRVSMLVIVDPSTGDDYNPAEKVKNSTQIVILQADRDGVEQITEALQNHAGVSCVHVICDGSEGSLQLGSTHLNTDNLDLYGWQLQHWAELLGSNAEILFYGGQVTMGDRGRALVKQIGLLTGATVKVL